MKRKVLFVCVSNSARSQMAEAFLDDACPDEFEAESAGLEPGTLNPLAVAAMQEIGIDLSAKSTKSAFDLFKAGRLYSYVITVCDEASAERCPIFPGNARRLHWSFPIPQLGRYVGRTPRPHTRIRDAIRAKIAAWCREVCAATSAA